MAGARTAAAAGGHLFSPAAVPGCSVGPLGCGALGLRGICREAWMRGEVRRSRPSLLPRPHLRAGPGGQSPPGGLGVAPRLPLVLPAGTVPRALPAPPPLSGSGAPPRWDKL